MVTRRFFVQLGGGAAVARGAAPVLRFAILSDIQYADQNTAGVREYRASLAKTEAAAEMLAGENAEFTVHLGDLIDGGAENADRILPVFRKLPRPQYPVLGNHDYFGGRPAVMKKFGLARPYSSVRVRGWEFVMLDGMYVSVKGGWPEGSPNYRKGEQMLTALKQQGARNAQEWNGALGEAQRAWLKRTLATASRQNRRAMVFCHFPTLAGACRPDHLLWDHAEVLSVLGSERCVAAYVCGHDHRGGYAIEDRIHHITMPGVVENDVGRCVRVAEVYPDRMMLRSPGKTDGEVFRW
jgi:manganese-dependent ADP-ribose/CDP-alcohol diphosphatase